MDSTPADLSTFRFSTKNLPPKERLAMWHEVFGRSVSRRTLSLPSGDSCHVEMTVQSLARGAGAGGGVCVQRMALTGGLLAERTPELLADGNDDIVLHVQETGSRVVSQLGHEAAVGPGGGLLTSNADASTIFLPEPTRFASIGLPRSLLAAMAPGIDDALMRPLPANDDTLRLLMRYLDILDEDALGTPDIRNAVATHIHDICALAIGTTRDAAEIACGRGLRAARLRAIKQDIARNLADGNLSATTLALRQRVTPRYIHKLFASEGTTFSRFVLGLRLVHVHRLLSDTRHADLTIGAIAYRAGFGDLSTFNRDFRRRFGATPSDIRAAVTEK